MTKLILFELKFRVSKNGHKGFHPKITIGLIDTLVVAGLWCRSSCHTFTLALSFVCYVLGQSLSGILLDVAPKKKKKKKKN